MTVLLDTADLSEAETALSAIFAPTRIDATPRDGLTTMRIERFSIGSLSIDSVDYTCGFRYDMDPPDQIMVCRVIRGSVESHLPYPEATVLGPGRVGALGRADDMPLGGRVHPSVLQHLIVEPELLGRLAAAEKGTAPPHLTGLKPISRDAEHWLNDLLDYLSRCAANYPEVQGPLLSSMLEQHVAATLLATFPNTAQLELTIEDRHDSTPVLLRRAVSYIDDNAHRDISVVDIAEAVHLTPRALVYTFRKHRGITSTEYVRRVRLHYAHLDLIRGHRQSTTVGRIARKWGFAHVGRFAVEYRVSYGQSPHDTLSQEY